MFLRQGLLHWKKPYPLDSIKKDIENKEVYIARDTVSLVYVHTFQLEITNNEIDYSMDCAVAYINKFATSPAWSRKGIGTISINFIEDFCRKKAIKKLILDVYDKSYEAINFYKHKGFVTTSERKTNYFNVFVMEKKII